MFRNYFKIAFRNIIRYKSYSFLNILGLTIGLACFILISLYIVDELSYDRYHTDAKKIYRVVNVYDDGKGVGEQSSSCPFPVSAALLEDYPEYIDQSIRLFNFQHPTVLLEIGEWKYNEPHFFFADSNIIDVFNIEFIHGNPNTALTDSRSVIITEHIAKKYFEEENPI